jgi:hypothetical protein
MADMLFHADVGSATALQAAASRQHSAAKTALQLYQGLHMMRFATSSRGHLLLHMSGSLLAVGVRQC